MSCSDYPTASDAKLFKDNSGTINEVIESTNDRTSPASDNKTKITLAGIENQVDALISQGEQDISDAIANTIDKNPLGAWQAGVTVFNSFNDYATFNSQSYKPRNQSGIVFPYTAQGADPTLSPDSGFIQPFTDVNSANIGVQLVTATGSTTPRRLDDRFADVVNVKDFGAVGDGVIDDTVPIQAAIYSGKKVEFGAGETYLVGGLTIHSDMTINLNGSTLLRNVSTWPGSTGGDGDEYIIYTDTPLSNVTIKNGYIDDRNLSAGGSLFRSFFGARNGGTITNFKFLNLIFLDSRSGVYCSSSFGSGYAASDVLVQDCKAYGVKGTPPTFPTKWNYVLCYFTTAKNVIVDRCRAGYMYHLCIFDRDYAQEGFPPTDNTVSNCECLDSFDTSVYSYAKRTLFTGNVITRPGKDGLKINSTPTDESGHSIISGNRIIDTGGYYRSDGSYGIVSAGRNNSISNNTFHISELGTYANGGYAIISIDAHTTINGNNIFINEGSNTYGGVALGHNSAISQDTDNKYASICGNSILGNVGIAIGISEPSRVSHYTVSDNTIHAYSNGIYHDNDTLGYLKPLFSSITGNVFVGGGYGDIISIRSACQVSFSNNTISGSRRRDMQSAAVLSGEGNRSDHGGDPSQPIDFRCFRRGSYINSEPSTGTYYVSQILSNGSQGTLCTESGTSDSISVTAETTFGSNVITVSDASRLSQGVVIDVAGESGPFVISHVDGATITINADMSASASGVSVTNHPPIWTAFDPAYA